ncbi:EamA family transporter [Roseixanthobacter pseudopolyaromaticivorans]|uniref:EamA family transporter n=1 Tax=Xanthobacteraceae TaxID=335928 RepID=UPI003726C666
MRTFIGSWQFWALGAAVFAALTAIFGKIGVSAVHSDLATLIRTVVILIIITLMVLAGRAWQPLDTISAKTWLFLVLSGSATGASWLCYFRALQIGEAAKVAPLDKLSVVMVAVFGALFLGERLSLVNWAGVALIAAGAILVALR